MVTKREFSTYDAAVAVIYGKKNADDTIAYPILLSPSAQISVTTGLAVPAHDQQIIDESDPNNVVITYKLSGATVATKTIAVSGTTTTITMTYV